jgi:hypothetical protein
MGVIAKHTHLNMFYICGSIFTITYYLNKFIVYNIYNILTIYRSLKVSIKLYYKLNCTVYQRKRTPINHDIVIYVRKSCAC